MRKTFILLLILVMFSASGCHTVRKKFTRKKKREEVIPVYVDFKNYPETPSVDAYIDYYLYTRGWLDELIGALDKGISFKRTKRAINEAIMNMEQLVVFYTEEGKEEFYQLYEDFVKVREDVLKYRNMSQNKRNVLIKKIERLKREFEKEFNYVDAEQWML